MKKNIAALIAGLLFGLGLAISQMTNPAKVLNFLDITGTWDPPWRSSWAAPCWLP